MRTTKKEFKNQVQEHIFNILGTDETTNPQEQLKNVVDEFNSWYSPYEQKRTPNRQEAFKEFVTGLPSCLNVEYYYDGIKDTMGSWFKNCGEEMKPLKDDKAADLYYGLIYRELNDLTKKNDIKWF